MRIGYVPKRYPRLSETFVLQEILQMEKRGASLVLFPIFDPHEPLQNPLGDRVRAPVVYLKRSFWPDMVSTLTAHCRLLWVSPQRYLQAIRQLVRVPLPAQTVIGSFLRGGRLASLAQQYRVEHLHAHFLGESVATTYQASLLTGIPFSISTHAKDLYTARPSLIAFFAKQTHFIATCTDFNVRYLRSILPPEDADTIHMVFHGVDTGRFQPPTTRPENPVPRIISVGRLVPKKGHEHLVEAARALKALSVPFRLEVYGDGPLRASLQSRLEKAGLENDVQLMGARQQDELIPVYQAADLFVLASVMTPDGDRDGIPNTLLEAMAAGLPVVSTEISGIPEVVEHGENGLLVPPADPASLATALQALLESEGLRRQLGTAARATVVERFDATQNAEVLASLFGMEGEVGAHRVPGA